MEKVAAFLAQIKEAMPETKYYLDWMLEDVDEKFKSNGKCEEIEPIEVRAGENE